MLDESGRDLAILAAGQALRLGSIGQLLPKPLAHVLGRPLLSYHLEHAATHPWCHVWVVVRQTRRPHLEDVAPPRPMARYVTQYEGTTVCHALRMIPNRCDRIVHVLHADNYTIQPWCLSCDGAKDFDALVLARATLHSDASPPVPVTLDLLRDQPGVLGEYLLSSDALAEVQPYISEAAQPSLEHFFARLISEGYRVGLLPAPVSRININTPRQLLDANLLALTVAARTEAVDLTGTIAAQPGSTRDWGTNRLIGPCFVDAGSQLQECTIGPQAFISGGARMERCEIADAVVQGPAKLSGRRLDHLVYVSNGETDAVEHIPRTMLRVE